ncbi:Bifunctional fucokinase/fucose pyrophosphorylase [Camellia lanceoleosa]|uniref:Bifunctional fucokinase/fucose pyrophosphorylase n=1 Tax=Camellia lanceoleosa TaxID=1840588 RepID=A0ACC0FN19_9ERIC|nr:Bifunctional fucokinase/fucose pyrophosphorylase [Camellia lanceoleosa]
MGFLKGGAHKRYLRQCSAASEEQKRDHPLNYMPSALLENGLKSMAGFLIFLTKVRFKLQMSLYEDLVVAWVPTKLEWLWPRPLGQELVNRLGRQKIFSYCAYESLIP